MNSPTQNLSEPLLLNFYGDCFTQMESIKSLAIGSTSSPSPSPEFKGAE